MYVGGPGASAPPRPPTCEWVPRRPCLEPPHRRRLCGQPRRVDAGRELGGVEAGVADEARDEDLGGGGCFDRRCPCRVLFEASPRQGRRNKAMLIGTRQGRRGVTRWGAEKAGSWGRSQRRRRGASPSARRQAARAKQSSEPPCRAHGPTANCSLDRARASSGMGRRSVKLSFGGGEQSGRGEQALGGPRRAGKQGRAGFGGGQDGQAGESRRVVVTLATGLCRLVHTHTPRHPHTLAGKAGRQAGRNPRLRTRQGGGAAGPRREKGSPPAPPPAAP